MINQNWNKKTFHSPETISLIAKIKNIKKKNLIRGLFNKNLTNRDIINLRKDSSLDDCVVIGALLKSENGLLSRNDRSQKKTSKNLYSMTSFPSLFWRNEVCYTVGYVNSFVDISIDILKVIKSLSQIENLDSESALNLLLECSKKYGASNFLSYKLAYLRSSRDLSVKHLNIVSKIEEEIAHRQNVGFHFSALENINSKLSLFMVAKRRISGLVD